jgi:nanoRNase/pAp phosphatase (c-di-AMP/oligoRNAs hydrolase)
LLSALLAHFRHKDRVLITIDPDPDSIASALALKRLLWRRVQNTAIGMIRPIKRLNNRAMVRLLKLPLVTINGNDLRDYDKFMLVDAQPHHHEFFGGIPYAAVLDHHPVNSAVAASFVDIRIEYGATSTMLTEYLRAAKIRPSQTLATALLYGIKTDTRNLERHTSVEDVKAFHYLFPLVNHNILRKIEISDLSLRDLHFFRKAIDAKHVVKDRIFAHLDKVPSPDILVMVAEFFLKVHDISWSIVSGVHNRELIVVVRNDGYRKDAGKALARAFGALGSAGGHRAMARAEIPLKNLQAFLPKATRAATERFIQKKMAPSL